nr:uncharacterized protein LOC127294293 isoform X2 [Lolium perenne]
MPSVIGNGIARAELESGSRPPWPAGRSSHPPSRSPRLARGTRLFFGSRSCRPHVQDRDRAVKPEPARGIARRHLLIYGITAAAPSTSAGTLRRSTPRPSPLRRRRSPRRRDRSRRPPLQFMVKMHNIGQNLQTRLSCSHQHTRFLVNKDIPITFSAYIDARFYARAIASEPSTTVHGTPDEAYDPLDPNGNITIKWDIMEWTSDGYTLLY